LLLPAAVLHRSIGLKTTVTNRIIQAIEDTDVDNWAAKHPNHEARLRPAHPLGAIPNADVECTVKQLVGLIAWPFTYPRVPNCSEPA
jgi:hypothetical protein